MPRQDQLGKVVTRVAADFSSLKINLKKNFDLGPNGIEYSPNELRKELERLTPDGREAFAQQYPGGAEKLLDDLNAI